MKWADLLRLVGDEPVFRTGLLLAGRISPAQVRLQLSRWVAAGRLLRLRRGVYALAPPWRRFLPHTFTLANALHCGSYVSLQAALGWWGVIPEHVPVATSMGPGRPEVVETELGRFVHRHVTADLMYGYERFEVAPGQWAFVARAAKALLDLVHLTAGADSPAYLRELRLQHCDWLDPDELHSLAERSGRPKLMRAAREVVRQRATDQEGWS